MVRKDIRPEKFIKEPNNKLPPKNQKVQKWSIGGGLRGPPVQLIHLITCGQASPHGQWVTKLNLAPKSFSI